MASSVAVVDTVIQCGTAATEILVLTNINIHLSQFIQLMLKDFLNQKVSKHSLGHVDVER